MTAFRYVGDGGHLEGVPARDLADDEFAGLSEDKQRDVRKCGLYEEVKATPAPVVSPPTPKTAPPVPAPQAEEKGES